MKHFYEVQVSPNVAPTARGAAVMQALENLGMPSDTTRTLVASYIDTRHNVYCYMIEATMPAFAFTTESPLTGGTESTPYSEDLEFEGAYLGGEITVTVSVGELPSGLALVETDGAWTIEGTPAASTAGEHTFTLQAVDAGGFVATLACSLTISS